MSRLRPRHLDATTTGEDLRAALSKGAEQAVVTVGPYRPLLILKAEDMFATDRVSGGPMLVHICGACSARFMPARSDAQFCSPTCRTRAFRERERVRVDRLRAEVERLRGLA